MGCMYVLYVDVCSRDASFRRRIELLQSFEFTVASSSVKVSPDGSFIAATGIYPPSVGQGGGWVINAMRGWRADTCHGWMDAPIAPAFGWLCLCLCVCVSV